MNDRTHGSGSEEALQRSAAGTSIEEEVDPHGEPLQAEALQAQGPVNAHPTSGEAPSQGASHGRGPTVWALARTPGFLRLWGAQVISNIGDWAYVLAVATVVASRIDPNAIPRAMALILAVESGASALTGIFLAGPIADRFPRRRVMVLADLVRALAVASVVVVSSPSPAHFAAVAFVLGAGHAMFQPALMSALPTLVGGERLVLANAVVTGTFHVAIMVGPMVGAALVATIGGWGAFAVNAASFVVSAALLIGLRIPATRAEDRAPWSPVADLVEGARFVGRSTVARGVIVAMGLTLFLVAAQKPLEIGIVRQVLAPAGSDDVRAGILGLLTTAFGVGMVAGSALAPSIARRTPRRRMLAASIAAVGACFLGAAAVPTTLAVVVLWVVAGGAAGTINVAYETLLQEHTPDGMLGRTFAAVEAAQEGTYFLGAVVVGAVGGWLHPVVGMAVVGSAFLGVAVVTTRSLPACDVTVGPVMSAPPMARVPVEP